MRLILVPTPIGNLEDITLRAVRMLKECDFIFCEDTRETRKLLQHLGIDKPLVSYHLNNEHHTLNHAISRIQQSASACLVTDAGTPAISDPGFLLVRACLQEGIEVECLPGATAFVPALAISGLPNDRFIFEGFLPHKKGRETRAKIIADETKTTIIYESPHRLLKTLDLLIKFCGPERKCSVSRELTKKFEETRRGSLQELHDHFSQNEPRGEFVMIISGKED
ncbi:MAG: 16S rRNA (cytidine(1402)-2'-O)-methyltransferase [Flavobacteriales bacterium]